MASSSAHPPSTSGPGASSSGGVNANPPIQASTSTTLPTARPRNPQLSNDPWFAYPTPTPEQIEEELPPYFEGENVPLGPLLDRLVRKGYGDLRYLLAEVLPPLSAKQKPKHIINYATTTRQALLKYLAVLRWKNAVDLPSIPSSSSGGKGQQSGTYTNQNGITNFPTPHSNGDDTSPPSILSNNKGKGKAIAAGEEIPVKGKVSDSRRLAQFMEHQNKQHDDAVIHLKHVTKLVESLRERNPDLLTALSLLTTGTYNRLPTNIIEPFIPKPPLTNSSILSLLKKLNRHVRYRLRCVDYLPPDLVVEGISDGQVYLRGGGENGWKARMTIVGFGEDSKWWLTGVEWRWRNKDRGVNDPGGEEPTKGEGKRFTGEERQSILDLANLDILPPREVDIQQRNQKKDQVVEKEKNVVDAPLVRIYNFLQHLSLSYQLEILFSQAMALSQGKWRNQLRVEIDRENKTLKVKYWIRPRPAIIAQQQQQAAVGKRPAPAASLGTARTPLVGGILSITLGENGVQPNETDSILGDVSSGGLIPNERVLRLQLGVKWEVGELGIGGGLKVGDVMDGTVLRIDSASLDMENLLMTSARAHAAHLTRVQASSLISSPKFILSLLNSPTLQESEDQNSPRPLTLRIPLPSRQRISSLLIGVSAYNGYIEIEDDGSIGNEGRANRVEMATKSINDGKTRLVDDIGRLTVAVVMENLEDQMRQLGWKPIRRLALRSQDLAKVHLHPATTILIPVPSSLSHYFVTKVTQNGLAFELLKTIKLPIENGLGVGTKFAVGDRVPLDLEKLRAGRKEKGEITGSPFEIGNKDLRKLYILSNALVAQTIIEQQLKERNIPFTAQYPPTTGPGAPRSSSALAGLVPTICVDVRDLLRDGKTGAAADVAMPKVGMQIENWWKGGRCEVTTIVQLRQQSSMSQASSSNGSQPHSEDISFDPSSSIVKFRAKDIERCVPAFLEQWERLSKVIVVAGEVNRLNKLAEFKDIKMLSFDLRTATLSYSKGYNASITYIPTNDSYQVILTSDQPSIPTSVNTDSSLRIQQPHYNPHERLSQLLSARLTQLASEPVESQGSIGKEFFRLLKNTLPFFEQVEKIEKRGWNLLVMDLREWRIVRDHGGRRYALDIILIPSLSHYLIQSAHKPRGPDRRVVDLTGKLNELPLSKIIPKVFDQQKALSLVSTSNGRKGDMPPLMKLDQNTSLLCQVGLVEGVLQGVLNEVDLVIGKD
uniref:Mediator of RNA polymerase II transcription subunit 14 n=1 Tax=Kwoniella bestiolae CBS 10118 TaxID=1296100 RepID=A0A1B9G940_9TREE|nr:hypothetical protein I302_02368 [Kwoniella bestiolae CBS 10118]OCF27526.1 hypothetical protein I302_02368 [Kwoniella bestiolae CBS 10118]